jgi:hypothetical protein
MHGAPPVRKIVLKAINYIINNKFKHTSQQYLSALSAKIPQSRPHAACGLLPYYATLPEELFALYELI